MVPSNRHGLHDPTSERDACGFGMIAQLDDQPSRGLVDTAIAALSRMTHRGGVAADGVTGDGCGLLIRRPEAFLRALAAEAGIALPATARFASCWPMMKRSSSLTISRGDRFTASAVNVSLMRRGFPGCRVAAQITLQAVAVLLNL